MKLKAKITGPKVHDVGYRIFLMEAALDCEVVRISEHAQYVEFSIKNTTAKYN
jgi:hypothetical protein